MDLFTWFLMNFSNVIFPALLAIVLAAAVILGLFLFRRKLAGLITGMARRVTSRFATAGPVIDACEKPLVLFIAVLVGRAVAFKPKREEPAGEEPVRCDEAKAVFDLAEMIRCKTVSDTDESKEDDAEFEKFEKLLPRLFPEVHRVCEFQKLGRRSLLFRWKGNT